MIIIISRNSYAIAIESERQFWGRIGENGYEIGLFGGKTWKDSIGETDEKKSLQ